MNMRMINFLKVTSIISYLLIILSGQIMGLPFICWLLFTIFDFGNIDQLFAALGIIGILLDFTKWKSNVLITILSLILMLSPLISRMVQVPIKMFNYLGFQVPLAIFIICYLVFIILNARNEKRLHSA